MFCKFLVILRVQVPCRYYNICINIVTAVNEAVDSVRREERKEDPSLAHTRYLWLKNPQNLTEKQKA